MTYAPSIIRATWLTIVMTTFVYSSECSAQASKEMTLREYIEYAGDHLDCYFSVESLQVTRKAEEVIPERPKLVSLLEARSTFERNPVDVDSVVTSINKSLSHVRASRNPSSRNTVNIVEGGLDELRDYPITRKVDFNFEGSAYDMVSTLAQQVPALSNTNTFLLGQIIIDLTPAKISVRDAMVRDILTTAIQTPGHERLLWTAETRQAGDRLETIVLYNGRKFQQSDHQKH